MDESGDRARLFLEWREDGYPEAITGQAAIYVERSDPETGGCLAAGADLIALMRRPPGIT